MSSKLHNLSEYNSDALPYADWVAGQRFVIIVADWNSDITFRLCQGALDTLLKHGALEKNIKVQHVPGTVELTYAAARAMDGWLIESNNNLRPDAIIVIGCVIKGDTPHFDYVCQSVTQGVTELNLHGSIPVIFSVLTTLNHQQALDRAGGKLGNKGVEGAITAIKMAHLKNCPPIWE